MATLDDIADQFSEDGDAHAIHDEEEHGHLSGEWSDDIFEGVFDGDKRGAVGAVEGPLGEFRGKICFESGGDGIDAAEYLVVGLIERGLGVALLDDRSCPIDKAPEPCVACDQCVEGGAIG